MPYIGTLNITDVHMGTIDPYIGARLAAGISPGTVNRDLACVRQVLNRAARVWRHENGKPWLATAPLIEMLPHDPRRPYVLTLQEQQAILSRLPASIARVALFAVNTGLRRSEVLGLRWEWRVQGHPAFIVPASHHKNRRDRLVVCNSIAASILEAQSKAHPVNVFSHNARPISWTVLKYYWTKARQAADLPQVRFHDLRHTYGSRLRAAGVGLEDRPDLLGHTGQHITTHYSQPDITRLLQAVEKIVDMETESALRLVKSDNAAATTGGNSVTG